MKFDTLKKPIYRSYLRQALRLITVIKNSIRDYKKEKELKVHWIYIYFCHYTENMKEMILKVKTTLIIFLLKLMNFN